MKLLNTPWRYVRDEQVRYNSLTGVKQMDITHWIRDSDDLTVALVSMGHGDVRAIADSFNLLAAAPELYAVLKSFPGFIDDCSKGDEWLERLAAAMAKAEGSNEL